MPEKIPTGSEIVEMSKKIAKSIGMPEILPESQDKLSDCIELYSWYDDRTTDIIAYAEEDLDKVRRVGLETKRILDKMVEAGCINPEVRDFSQEFIDKVLGAVAKGDSVGVYEWGCIANSNRFLIGMNIAWRLGKP
jgi:hypothetical protein